MSRNFLLLACVVFAGCGRMGYDGLGIGDDPIDTGEPGPVSVRVVDPTGPVATHPVFFNASDGSLLGMDLTDPDGNVTFVIPPGAMVTVLHPSSGDTWMDLQTLADIQPGDQITFGLDIDTWEPAGDATIMPLTSVPGAVEYVFEVGCNTVVVPDVGSQTVMEVPISCAPSSDVTIVAHAHDVDSNDLTWAYAKNVPIAGPVTLSGWSATRDSYNLVIDDTPASSVSGSAGIGAVVNGVSIWQWSEGMDFSVGEFTKGVDFPTGFTEALDYVVGVDYAPVTVGPVAFSPSSTMYSRSETLATLRRISATELLPGIVDIAFTGGPPSRPTLSFQLESEASADLGFGGLSWSDAEGNYYGWKLCFGPDVREFQLPELPGFLANVVPPASFDEYTGMEVGVMDFDFVADYASIRNDYPYGGLEEDYYLPAGEHRIRTSVSGNPFEDN